MEGPREASPKKAPEVGGFKGTYTGASRKLLRCDPDLMWPDGPFKNPYDDFLTGALIEPL